MDDSYATSPWGFSLDLLELGLPDKILAGSYVAEGGATVKTEVRVYALSDETVVMVDLVGGALPEDAGRVAHDAWALAGSPSALRLVWHAFQSWGDSYEEDVFRSEGKEPVVDRGAGNPRLVLVDEGRDADELMRRLVEER